MALSYAGMRHWRYSLFPARRNRMLMSSMRESVPERQSCALAAQAVPSSNRRAAGIRRGMPVSFDYQGTTGDGTIQDPVRLQKNSFEPWINPTEHGGYSSPASSRYGRSLAVVGCKTLDLYRK